MTGERADWACYDLIAEGYSGIMDITGEADGVPQKIGAPAADMLAGQDAAFATVSALLSKQRTGRGHVLDIALIDSMTRFLGCRIMPYLASGDVPTRSGGKDSVIAIYQSFDTKDAPITLALGNNNIWQRFWDVVGRPAMASDPDLQTNVSRRERRRQIVETIQKLLYTKPRDHWLALFRSSRVPSGPINRIDEVVDDPVLRERGMFYRVHTNGRSVPQIGTGIQVDGMANATRGIPPRLGEHTDMVLHNLLGMSETDRKPFTDNNTTARSGS
jgi:crotonobetainyl-CoA:carnitine CoA-transferase CaiB-like acyl-CoA transferase